MFRFFQGPRKGSWCYFLGLARLAGSTSAVCLQRAGLFSQPRRAENRCGISISRKTSPPRGSQRCWWSYLGIHLCRCHSPMCASNNLHRLSFSRSPIGWSDADAARGGPSRSAEGPCLIGLKSLRTAGWKRRTPKTSAALWKGGRASSS